MMCGCIRKISASYVVISVLTFSFSSLITFQAPAYAETLQQALSAAYVDNPDLNAERASVRAIDENVSQALSTGRPTVLGTGDASIQDSDTRNTIPPTSFNRTSHPRGFTVSSTGIPSNRTKPTTPWFSTCRTLATTRR